MFLIKVKRINYRYINIIIIKLFLKIRNNYSEIKFISCLKKNISKRIYRKALLILI